ncbi:histidinol-phosphatase [Ketogulonicigenium vulgare]|uniref:Histidinol-phosphatase n=1 Tax=Ketogulonicigenium vulgare (strain WSH-001) TaxID=759362 RepID=F9Y3K7_KETVW|nr:histidinol-phosphatase [Ketogulonicigenium vulgare]ADO43340.1 inositol monophosphatase family protein [Ketogulonicigenium vulgare Y25]AEM41627.1 Inositol monophosphatase family protein [Ketogulonicigenium vulgare WSH-001]ALJ81742.1 inositol monophosphatase [Ketogulonicigenium vulgare]ANW34405.1 histidinol-phosphatase [Ketogulonicigenium vulgare]AOZ55377.1 inositol monophosphatase family protein [Ketogulonicigenium vulgare]
MTRVSPALAADLRRVAHLLADAARPVTLQHFRRGIAADNKGPAKGVAFDPVTIADRESEMAMRAILARERPDDAILGEEFGHQPGNSGLTWVLDPIDGTRAYIAGAPTWGVLVAVSDDQGPLFGLIDQPYIGERFAGGFGRAECVGPQGTSALQTRAARALSDAIVMTTYPEVGTPTEAAAFHTVAAQARLTRYGMDCYAYAMLAAGQIDLVIEAGLQSYDVQGPIAVIEGAGGIVTDWQGGPAWNGGRVLAAANAEVHAEALAILSQTL